MKRLELPNWMLVHWVLNPGLAINELILGQRLPKVMLICQSCPGPLMERQYVLCPECETIHDGRLWAGLRGFGNWLGYVCPTCKQRIPCLWNVCSLLLLCLLSPLWYLPYRLYFRDRLGSPPAQQPNAPLPTVKNVKWWKMGLGYGVFMWVAMSLAPAVAAYGKTGRMPMHILLSGGVIWLLAGVAFGLFMYLFMSRKSKQ